MKSPAFGVNAPITPVMSPEAEILVKAPDPAIVDPIAPGEAKVAPPSKLAFKLLTTVLLATTKGGVPEETVLVICPATVRLLRVPISVI